MLDGIFEAIGEVLGIMENPQSAYAELVETGNPDIFETDMRMTEVDETRINETAEIMADVFDAETLANWPEMTMDERTAKLNEYYVTAGENLGIDTKGVIIEPMPSSSPGVVNMGYNSGDGYIHINEYVLEDPEQLGQILDTATHEMRHQFQSDVLENPQAFGDIPQDVLDTWAYEMDPNHYISPDYDFEAYTNQAIERDARDFAGNTLEAYMNKMDLN